jgi:hypothetical protein
MNYVKLIKNNSIIVVVILSHVLRVILGWDIPFVYPNCDWTRR